MEYNEYEDPIAEEKPRAPMHWTLKINKKIMIPIAGGLVVLAALFYLKGLFVAALVNGSPISRIQVIEELEKQSGKQALESLITQKLIQGELDKKNITVANDAINEEIKKIEARVSQQGGTLQVALAQQGLTEKKFRERVVLQKRLEKLLADKTAVSDEEVSKYIKDNKIAPSQNAKPEDTKNQIKDQLKQQKFSQQAQELVTNLKKTATIRYFVMY